MAIIKGEKSGKAVLKKALELDGVKEQTKSVIKVGRSSNYLHRTATKINVACIHIDGVITPAAGYLNTANKHYNPQFVSGTFGALLNGFFVFELLKTYNVKSKSRTSFEKIADNFVVNISLAFVETIKGANGLRVFLDKGKYIQQATNNLTKELFEEASKKYVNFSNNKMLALPAPKGAVAFGMKHAASIGKAAGWLGVLVSSFKAADGFISEDYSKGLGNTLMAIGGAMMIYFIASGVGLAIGAILVIVGAVIEYSGKRSPLDDWAFRCFFGTTGEYWGDKRDETATKLRRSWALALPDHAEHSFIVGKFEEEVKDLEEIINPLQVIDVNKQDFEFEIYLPFSEEGEFELKVEINIEGRKRKTKYEVISWDKKASGVLHGADVKYLDGESKVAVDFEGFIPEDFEMIFSITAEIEYKRPDGEISELSQDIFEYDIRLGGWRI